MDYIKVTVQSTIRNWNDACRLWDDFLPKSSPIYGTSRMVVKLGIVLLKDYGIIVKM